MTNHVEEIRRAVAAIRDTAADCPRRHVELAIADWLDEAADREEAYGRHTPPVSRCDPAPGDEAHAAWTIARAWLGKEPPA